MRESTQKVLKRALHMLAYQPNTEAALRRKLREKGGSSADIEAVVVFLKQKGYLDEQAYLYRLVDTLGNTRCYGRRRIYAACREKGFDPEVMDIHFDAACEQVDFVAACRRRIAARDTSDREKLIAALLRLGYDYSTIRAAMQGDE